MTGRSAFTSIAAGRQIGGFGYRADRARFVDAQNNALGQIELVVDPILPDVSGSQILAEDEGSDARIHEDAAATPPGRFHLHTGEPPLYPLAETLPCASLIR